MRFGGQTPQSQKVYYINLQEIKGIKFGTRNPINYYDTFYNAELFLRAHGTYSIKIVNPLQFYAEAIPKNMDHVEITDINEQYLSEFLEALAIQARSVNELGDIANAIREEIKISGSKPYKYITIDNATRLEEMCMSFAIQLYKNTQMGKRYEGTDLRTLPNGAGY